MARARQRATPEGRTRRRRAGFARYHWCRRPRRTVSRVPSAHILYEYVYPPGTDAADLLVQLPLPFVLLRQVTRDVEIEHSPLAAGLGWHERHEHPLGTALGTARAVAGG